jgi:hypothetical protein
MKVQIFWDCLLIAEALTSVEETEPTLCECCGRMKPRYWRLRPIDTAVERIESLKPDTHLRVRIEPE